MALGTTNVDAAISKVEPGATPGTFMVDPTGEIIDVGVPCSSVQTPFVGMAVAKSGQGTGCTKGCITSVNTSLDVGGFRRACGSKGSFTVHFTNQVIITPGDGTPVPRFSAEWDSGALIVSNDLTLNPVALLFAKSYIFTVGNPIQDVVDRFKQNGGGGHTFAFVGNDPCPVAAALLDCKTPPGTPVPVCIAPLAAEVESARMIKERYESDLFAMAGVIGVGVGADETDPTKAAIVVYLNTEDTSQLKAGVVPRELDGVKVRVIPTDPFVAL